MGEPSERRGIQEQVHRGDVFKKSKNIPALLSDHIEVKIVKKMSTIANLFPLKSLLH